MIRPSGKIIVQTFLVSVFFLSSFLPASAKTMSDFSDAPSPASGSLYSLTQYLLRENVLDGYPDGTLRLWQPISRVEALALFLRAFPKKQGEMDTQKMTLFPDVESSSWYASYVEQALNAGVAKGFQDGTFGPGKQVTRAEGIAFLLRLLGQEVSSTQPWYDAYIGAGAEKQLDSIPVLYDASFAQAPLMRKDALRLLANAVQFVNKRDARYEDKELGKVSYYADNLSGHGMSSGQKYSPYVYSAAHKTVAFDHVLQVIDEGQKESVLVPVKDRGPHTKGFIVDLSRIAFEALGSTRRGIFSGAALEISSTIQMSAPKKLLSFTKRDLVRDIPSYLIQGEMVPVGIQGTSEQTMVLTTQRGTEEKIVVSSGTNALLLFDEIGDYTLTLEGLGEKISLHVLSPFSGKSLGKPKGKVEDVHLTKQDGGTYLLSWKLLQGNNHSFFRLQCMEGADPIVTWYVTDVSELTLSHALIERCHPHEQIPGNISLDYGETSTPFAHDVYTDLLHQADVKL